MSQCGKKKWGTRSREQDPQGQEVNVENMTIIKIRSNGGNKFAH